MLHSRLIIGALLIAALAGICWLDVRGPRPGVFLASLALLAAALAAGEMRRLFRHRGVAPSASAMYLGTLLPVAACCVPVLLPNVVVNYSQGSAGWLATGLTFGLMAALVSEMRCYDGGGQSISRIAHAALSSLYVGGMIGSLVQLRLINAPGELGGWRALFPLLTLIATVKLSDTCQYAIGRIFGRRKLAPRLSPGKTWEGAVGGILTATLIAAASIAVIVQGTHGLRLAYFPYVWCYTLTIAVAGLIGDLAESLLKRDAGVKDSSDWLPGFGGVLDLLDSLLFAAPVGYLWWVIGVIGP